MRLTADRARSLDLSFDTSSPLRSTASVTGDMLTMRGKAPAHVNPSYVGYNTEPRP